MITVDEKYFREQFPKRRIHSHKGDFGRILIFAGSCGMAGAAILAGTAAVRSGAGLVRFLLPSYSDPIYPILQTAVPEATCITPEQIGFYCNTSRLMPDEAAALLNEYSAIAAGSGLGRDAARINILRFIIENYRGILVLDADALNAVAGGSIPEETVCKTKAKIIITPHIGEAKRLLVSGSRQDNAAEQRLTGSRRKAPREKQRRIPENIKIKSEEERLTAVQALSKKFHCTALLKGAGTLVRGSSGMIYKNTTGNPGMATGGSGDVLSGIIAAFAGQGLPPEIAAACGAYLHGKAGDLAAEQLGQVSMSAADLPDFLSDAWLA